MTQCRFCKSEIPSDATRCPHCTSFLDADPPQGSPAQVTYIVDKGLVTFMKFAGAILAIFLTVGLFFYGLDIKQLSKEIEDTHVESQKLDLNIKQAKMDLERETADIKKDVESAEASAKQAKLDLEKETADIKKDVESAEASAKVASDTSSKARDLLHEAEQSKENIHQYEITLIRPLPGSKLATSPQASQPAPNPGQLEHLIEAKLLETLKEVLPPKQYSALQTRIGAEKRGGLRRQVFDAKNTTNLPGDLVRSEGDAPISDPTANEVYDNLGVVYRFFKDVFGWEIPDNKGKTLIVTVHFGKDYGNGFWSGEQITLGDGAGEIFRKDTFIRSLSGMARYIGFAMNQYTAQLANQDQSGALNDSFADIMSCLVEQWQKKQTADEASWLVGADMFVPGFKGRALYDMANPGTAYDDPKTGKDPQPGHMKDYVQTEEDNGGVHTNSGIPNRAFVLAAKAIGGNSWEKAGKIWFVTLTERLTANADFAKCAAETVSVARELFPDDSSIAAKVAKAWTDVGVLGETPTTAGSRMKR